MAIDQACVTEVRHKLIKIEDHNRKVLFKNSDGKTYYKIRVDGCVSVDGKKADYVVERGSAAVIVELKGGGVEKGLRQIIETAKLWVSEKRTEKLCGLLIGKNSPGASSTVQSKKLEFAKIAKGPVHICNGERTLEFDQVFNSHGIEKKTKR